jgi:hypothetical protein
MFCLMLLALSLRALVPVGYMPDVDALRDGRLEMAFCSGNGPQTIAVDMHSSMSMDMSAGMHHAAHHGSTSSSDESPANPQSQSTDCPFSVLSTLPAMPTIALAVIGLPLLLSAVQPALYIAPLPAVLFQGPPLGSRAPPSHLV